MAETTTGVTGGCQCGAVRYRYEGEPTAVGLRQFERCLSFAFTATRLGCPIDTPLHLLTWHVLPVAIGTFSRPCSVQHGCKKIRPDRAVACSRVTCSTDPFRRGAGLCLAGSNLGLLPTLCRVLAIPNSMVATGAPWYGLARRFLAAKAIRSRRLTMLRFSYVIWRFPLRHL
jgi:hypothetical protein